MPNLMPIVDEPVSVDEPFGEQLKALRERRNLSLRQASHSLKARGVEASPSSLSNWERGTTKPPVDNLAALSAVYDVAFALNAGRIVPLDVSGTLLLKHLLATSPEDREMLASLTTSGLLKEATLGEYDVDELLDSVVPKDLICYTYAGETRYPSFQFDLADRRAHAVVLKVNELLGAQEDPLGTLAWWVGSNARVEGYYSPKQLLRKGEDNLVYELAQSLVGNSG